MISCVWPCVPDSELKRRQKQAKKEQERLEKEKERGAQRPAAAPGAEATKSSAAAEGELTANVRVWRTLGRAFRCRGNGGNMFREVFRNVPEALCRR